MQAVHLAAALFFGSAILLSGWGLISESRRLRHHLAKFPNGNANRIFYVAAMLFTFLAGAAPLEESDPLSPREKRIATIIYGTLVGAMCGSLVALIALLIFSRFA